MTQGGDGLPSDILGCFCFFFRKLEMLGPGEAKYMYMEIN